MATVSSEVGDLIGRSYLRTINRALTNILLGTTRRGVACF